MLKKEWMDLKMDLIDVLSQFDSEMALISSKTGFIKSDDVLKLTDNLRDEKLIPLGVKLEDTHNGSESRWKLYDRVYFKKYLDELDAYQRKEKILNRSLHPILNRKKWLN